jgi:hypothetical protein
VGDLRGDVAAVHAVGADDRHHDEPLDAGPLAFALQVLRRGHEELRRGGLVGSREAGRVDDGLDAGQRVGQPFAGDHVDAVGAGDRDDVVPALAQDVDDVAADAAGRARNCDLAHD